MPHLHLARDLTDACAVVYGGNFAPADDLPNQQNVSHYVDPVHQQKYIHMYFAKYVGLWRAIRTQLEWDDLPLCSIGAGPGLCAFGWFWDTPPQRKVDLVDVLPWGTARRLPSHMALAQALLGGKHQWLVERLDIGTPPQVAHLPSVPGYKPAAPSTILLPFIANHIVGRQSPIANPQAFWNYVDNLRTRGNRVVVADIRQTNAPGLWTGAPARARNFAYDATWLQPAYASEGPRRTSKTMCTASVLYTTSAGWSTLG